MACKCDIHPNLFGDVKTFMDGGEQIPSPELVNLYKDLIAEEYAEFIDGVNNNDPIETLDGLVDTVWVIIGYCIAAGYDFDGAWKEVAASNLSKLDPDTGKAIKNEAGKIMKPASYFKPDLTKFIGQ
jgi:hypothetical protein